MKLIQKNSKGQLSNKIINMISWNSIAKRLAVCIVISNHGSPNLSSNYQQSNCSFNQISPEETVNIKRDWSIIENKKRYIRRYTSD